MGIMFAAQKKAASYYDSAKETITGVVLTVAIMSILYLVTVIFVEIYMLYTEDVRRKALARRTASDRKRDSKKSARAQASGAGVVPTEADQNFVVGDVSNAMNPMFMTAGGTMASVATDTNAAAEAIRSMVNPPPTLELWQVYKETFMQLRGRLEDLKMQQGTFSQEVKDFAAAETARAVTNDKSIVVNGRRVDADKIDARVSASGGYAAEGDPSHSVPGENELAALRSAVGARVVPPVPPPGSPPDAPSDYGGAGSPGGRNYMIGSAANAPTLLASFKSKQGRL